MNEKIAVLTGLAFLAMVVTACQPFQTQEPAPTGGTGATATPGQGGSLSIQNPFNPVPGDALLVRGQAFVDSVQWNPARDAAAGELLFKGSLPSPCHQLRLGFAPLTADKHLDVEAYTLSRPDEVCIQVIQEFSAVVTLTGLEPGEYSLSVNGRELLRFTHLPGEGEILPTGGFTRLVRDILDDPGQYSGREVVIVGYYRGWNLLGEAEGQSPVTRSDWVIKDSSAAIYVSAQGNVLGELSLAPGSLEDTTRVLRLRGIVRLTSTGQAYIEPAQVELFP